MTAVKIQSRNSTRRLALLNILPSGRDDVWKHACEACEDVWTLLSQLEEIERTIAMTRDDTQGG